MWKIWHSLELNFPKSVIPPFKATLFSFLNLKNMLELEKSSISRAKWHHGNGDCLVGHRSSPECGFHLKRCIDIFPLSSLGSASLA